VAGSDEMGLFDFLKPKPAGNDSLARLIEDNADHIAQIEGKDRKEATYLSICLVLDDLKARTNGVKGHQEVMNLLMMGPYQEHMNDVMTYLAWSTGKIKLKPEYEAELVKRHRG
jgi:hypothetical protein